MIADTALGRLPEATNSCDGVYRIWKPTVWFPFAPNLCSGVCMEQPQERRERLKQAWAIFSRKNAPVPRIRPKDIPTSTEIQEKDLWELWFSITVYTPPSEKLEILKGMALRSYFGVYGKQLLRRREKFNKRKKRLCWIKNCDCFVCGAPANLRHHIVQLKNGGHNHAINIVPLCHACHLEIHPWMAR